jgi:hypothetical protein
MAEQRPTAKRRNERPVHNPKAQVYTCRPRPQSVQSAYTQRQCKIIPLDF